MAIQPRRSCFAVSLHASPSIEIFRAYSLKLHGRRGRSRRVEMRRISVDDGILGSTKFMRRKRRLTPSGKRACFAVFLHASPSIAIFRWPSSSSRGPECRFRGVETRGIFTDEGTRRSMRFGMWENRGAYPRLECGPRLDLPSQQGRPDLIFITGVTSLHVTSWGLAVG
jgi:hypothetical protein